MKLKHLEQNLQQLNFNFSNPKINLEQYHTPPHLAASMLHTIQSNYDDICNKVILDIGCGSGILTFGCILLEADFCFGFDIDEEILVVFNENKQEFEVSNCDALLFNVNSKTIDANILQRKVDTVIMNPPFGTRNPGIDLDFVQYACSVGKVVYSLHKTSTRDNIVRKIKAFNRVKEVEVIAEMKYNLDQSYKFHKKNSHDINVDLLRIITDDYEEV